MERRLCIGDIHGMYSKLTDVLLLDTIGSIGNSAFSTCSSLAGISIPDTVTIIDNSAFSYCHSLREVVLPAGLQTLGRYAFYYCEALESVAMPYGLSDIGSSVFDKCDKLVLSVVKGSTAETYATENSLNVVYYTPSTEINQHEVGSFENYEYRVEKDGTVYITRWYGNDSVLQIPSELNGKQVTGIAKGAFSISQQLREVVIPEGIREIDEYAFALCSKLEKITLPESIIFIDDNAFSSCPEVLNVIAPDGSYAAEWKDKH